MSNSKEFREFTDTRLRFFIYMLKGQSNTIINKLFRTNDFISYKKYLPSIGLRDINDIYIDSYGYFFNKKGSLYNELPFFLVNMSYIKTLFSFYEYLESLPSTQSSIAVYRGCYSLEKDGLTGLVCTSTDEKVAKSFERGTLLKINIPVGSQIFDVDSIPINSNPEISINEHEIVLPPCDYMIKSEGKIPYGSGELNFYELDVKLKNLLEEFYEIMFEDKANYTKLLNKQQLIEFKSALSILKIYLTEHNRCTYNGNKTKSID